MASYVSQVNVMHRQFQASLKRAKSRQSVMNAYWAHKRQHERVLKKHLKEEMAQVNRIKNKLDYR
jgi:tripartite-type tricarboxylate transporter receptor subunit TctC